MRKNKDVSTIYSKMTFGSDDELSIVVSNLPFVLKNLKDMPVTDAYIYGKIYGEGNSAINLFLNNITPATSIYNIFKNILFNELLYPIVITHIRMAIQLSSSLNPAPIQPQVAGETK